MSTLRRFLKTCLRAMGCDIVRYPAPESLMGHLRQVLAGREIDCVIDVGAHHGEYGSLLRRAGYRGRIISFEPTAASFEALSRRAASDGRWTAHRLALGSEDGEAAIHVPRSTDMASFLKPARDLTDWPGAELMEVDRVEKVPVRRLDGVLPELLAGIPTPRLYLKLDTQGWDLQVLRGAEEVLPRVLALQSEVSLRPIYRGMPGYRESIDFLNRRGFEITGLFPITRDRDLTVIEMDCVMVRTGRVPAGMETAGREPARATGVSSFTA